MTSQQRKGFLLRTSLFLEKINDEIVHDESLIEELTNIQDNDHVVISDYHKGTLNESDINNR